MAKTNQIKKLVNGEIADADDVNQIVEDAGNEGGAIPYNPVNHQRITNGSVSLGSTTYPWGSLNISRDAYLYEVETTSPSVASSVQIKHLREFIYLKDVPQTYVGQGGKFLRANLAENAIEFSTPVTSQIFKTSGTFVAPAAVTQIYITMIGGGGAGGAGNFDTSRTGGGGGAGGWTINTPYTVVPGNSYTVVVGAGGAGGSGNGANGSASSFDTAVSAPGGTGGNDGPSFTGGAGGGGLDYSGSSKYGCNKGGAGGEGNGGTGTSEGGGSPFGIAGQGKNGAGGTGGAAPANSGAGGGGGGGGGIGGNGGNGGSGVVIISF